MTFRALALLILAAPLAAPQASDDWLSAKEWWGEISYEVADEGSDGDAQWKLAERVSVDVHLGMPGNGMGMDWPGKVDVRDGLQRGRFQSWTIEPSPNAWGTAWVSGEGWTKVGATGSTVTTEKTRSGSVKLGVRALLQVDIKSGVFGFYVSVPSYIASSEVKTLEEITVESSGSGSSSRKTSRWTTGQIVGAKADPLPVGDLRANSTTLFIWNQKLPARVADLKGSMPIPMKGRGKASGTLTWSFTGQKPPSIELELEAKGDAVPNWEDWRPMGGKDEKTPGSRVTLTARLVSPGALPDKPHYFKILLTEVSREKGVCINYPLKPEDDPPYDFSFLKTDNPGRDILVQDRAVWTVDATGPEFKAKLACFDYGAWGEVTAEAILESGRTLVAHVKGAPSERVLRLPHRSPTSKIATVWKSPGADDADDDDDPVGDGQKGDGLTNYEEYRGFMVNGNWREGDPKKKDYFVRNEAGAAAEPGIALFESIAKLEVHRLGPDEISSVRVVNFNRSEGPHKVDQHGIRIVAAPAQKGYCKAFTNNDGPGLPKDVLYVGIGTIPAVTVKADAGGGSAKAIQYSANPVAHELLHCCNVYHHGEDPGRVDAIVWTLTSTGSILEGSVVIDVLDEKTKSNIGSKIKSWDASNHKEVKVRGWRGLSSGDTSCVMRYDDSQAYVPFGRPLTDRVLIANFGDPQEPVGASLCTSDAATDTNVTPGRFGPCTKGRGDCSHQIVVNDAAKRTVR